MLRWFNEQLAKLFTLDAALTLQQRNWIEDRFEWLKSQFGEEILTRAPVLPTDEFFPERYIPDEAHVQQLFERLCQLMSVDPQRLVLSFYTSASADHIAEAFRPLRQGYALGVFSDDDDKLTIWLENSHFNEPAHVIATLVHELGHVLLLADGRISQDTPDHEELTDLLTLYFGFGVFSANGAIREVNWSLGNYSGWSHAKAGYLSIGQWAYALAIYAFQRGEREPRWSRYVRPDARAMFQTELSRLWDATTREVTAASDSLATMRPLESVRPDPGQLLAASDHLQIAAGESEATADDDSVHDPEGDGDFAQGIYAMSRQDFPAAIEVFERVISQDQDDWESWLQLSLAHLWQRNINAAAQHADQAISLNRDCRMAYIVRAWCDLVRGQFADALSNSNAAQRLDGRDPDAYVTQGLAYAGLGKYLRSLTSLSRSIQLDPLTPHGYLARCRVYELTGKRKLAEADLRRLIYDFPEMQDAAHRQQFLAWTVL